MITRAHHSPLSLPSRLGVIPASPVSVGAIARPRASIASRLVARLAPAAFQAAPPPTAAPIPSQESPDEPDASTQAADNILVAFGEHWDVTEVEVLGESAPVGPISFNVYLYEDGNFGPGRELFAERAIAAR